MNPYAQSPYVISVGATSFDGRMLCDYSSRGDPKRPSSGPTVVSSGLGILNININPDYQRSVRGHERDLELFGRNGLEKWFTKTGTSFSNASVAGMMVLIATERERLGLSSEPNAVKKVIESIALPVPFRGPWEVGAGFVNYFVVNKYINIIRKNRSEFFPSNYKKKLWRFEMDLRYNLRAIQKIIGLVLSAILYFMGFSLLNSGLKNEFELFIEYKGFQAVLLNAAPGLFLFICGTVLASIVLFRKEVMSSKLLEDMGGKGYKVEEGVSVQSLDD